ncbi:hypothetical protein DENSPDRAFT_812229 [Dentipellis sp. KUC8613]|nr:hypothetical protein DENSPDRAFT_812229 [Dentipellis sp. KUC8613]
MAELSQDTAISRLQKSESDTKVDPGSLKPRPNLFRRGVTVKSVAFSPDGLASATETGVHLWRMSPGSESRDANPPSMHASPVRDVAFTPDGELLASGSANGTVLLWHQPLEDNPEERIEPVLREVGPIASLRFSPDGSRLAVITQRCTSYVVDIRIGVVLHELKDDGLPTLLWQCKPAFTPDGAFLVCACTNGMVTIWDTEQLGSFVAKCHTEAIYALDVSPDGKRFASGAADGTLFLGTLDDSGRPRPAGDSAITGHRGAIFAVEFAKQGDFFASGSQDCTVRLWQSQTGEPIAVYASHTDLVSSISITFDGAIVASGSRDGTVCLWDTKMHDAIAGPVQRHTSGIRSIVFSPDGKLLASISLGQTVRVGRLHGDGFNITRKDDGEQPGQVLVEPPSRLGSPSKLMYVHGVPQSPGGSILYTSAQTIQEWATSSAIPQYPSPTARDLIDVPVSSAQSKLAEQDESWLILSDEIAAQRGRHGPTDSEMPEETNSGVPAESTAVTEGHLLAIRSPGEDAIPTSPGFSEFRFHVRQSISNWWGTVQPRRPAWFTSSQKSTPSSTPPEAEDTRKRVGKAVVAVLGKKGLDVAHEALAMGVDLLQFAPVPGLEAAGYILLDIWDAFEQTQTNRSACERLAIRCADILFSVREEVNNAGSGVIEELNDPITRLNESFDKIRDFTKQQVQLPFLKRYLGREKILRDIEACHADLSDAQSRFGFSIQIRTLRLQSEAAARLLSLDNNMQTPKLKELLSRVDAVLKEQNSQDRKQDEDRLRRLMRDAIQAKDDLAVLDLLQISRDEMPEAMWTLRRSVNQDGKGPVSKEAQAVPGELSHTPSSSVPTRSRRQLSTQDDNLDRQFMQTGVEALQRLTAQTEKNADLPSWTITRYEVEREQRIGMGFFSDVYKGAWRERTVAIKVLTDTVPREMFIKEATIWKKLSHPHVSQLLGASSASSSPPWFFVSPYYEKGNLVTFLRKTPDIVSWRLRRIIREVVRGMAYLHREKILHGDLKAANILVADDLHCVVSDFGQSEMKSEVCRLSGVPIVRGTLRWQAPELLTGSNSHLTPQVDVYAFAICCSEIFGKGALPWPLLDDVAVRHLVINENKRPPILSACPRVFQDVIESCWDRDPAARPSFAAVRFALFTKKNNPENAGKNDR